MRRRRLIGRFAAATLAALLAGSVGALASFERPAAGAGFKPATAAAGEAAGPVLAASPRNSPAAAGRLPAEVSHQDLAAADLFGTGPAGRGVYRRQEDEFGGRQVALAGWDARIPEGLPEVEYEYGGDEQIRLAQSGNGWSTRVEYVGTGSELAIWHVFAFEQCSATDYRLITRFEDVGEENFIFVNDGGSNGHGAINCAAGDTATFSRFGLTVSVRSLPASTRFEVWVLGLNTVDASVYSRFAVSESSRNAFNTLGHSVPFAVPFGFIPGSSTVTISVPEYLGDGNAPVDYLLGQVRVAEDATSWSIVNSPAGFKLATVSRSATILLAQARNLDFEALSNKEFATLTVRAGDGTDTADQPVVLRVVNVPVTSTVASFDAPRYYRFAGQASFIARPVVRLNGFVRGTGSGLITGKSGVGSAHVTRGTAGRVSLLSTLPANADVLLTVRRGNSDTGDESINVLVSTRIQGVTRPVQSDRANVNGNWVLEYTSFVCNDLNFQVQIGSHSEEGDCDSSGVAIGSSGASFDIDTSTTGTVKLVLRNLPSSGNLAVYAYTEECNQFSGQAETDCIRSASRGTSVASGFTLPLTAPLRFDHPDEPLLIDVVEYLGNGGVAPVDHVLGTIRLRGPATGWSIVGTAPGYKLATTSLAATILLAQTINLDFEDSSYATAKEFVTLTIEASNTNTSVSGRITTVLRLVDAVVSTVAVTGGTLITNYIRFVNDSTFAIEIPSLVVNGVEVSHADTVLTLEASGRGGNFINLQESGLILISGLGRTEDVTFTLELSSPEGGATVSVTSRYRSFPRPRIESFSRNGSNWELEYAQDFECDLMVIAFSYNGSGGSGRCDNSFVPLNYTDGALVVRTDPGGAKKIIISNPPSSGNMTLGVYTRECPEYGLLEELFCRAGRDAFAGSTHVQEVIPLPLSGWPLIEGGTRQIIRTPEFDGRWLLDNIVQLPGHMPAGYIAATLFLAPGYSGNVDWSLEGTSADFAVEGAAGRSRVAYITLKRSKSFVHADGARLATLTVRAANSTIAFSTSEVILELIPNPLLGTVARAFRNVGPRNMMTVVPDIERTFTIFGVTGSNDPVTRIEGEYSAVLATGPLPYWLTFDPATREFTVAPEAATAGGDYQVRLRMVDRSESPPAVYEHDFTLRVLQPMHYFFTNASRVSRLDVNFRGGGWPDSGDSGANLDKLSYIVAGMTTTFNEDIRCEFGTGPYFNPAQPISTDDSTATYNANIFLTCNDDHTFRIVMNSNGDYLSSTSQNLITISLEVNIAGVRQTVVQAVTLGNNAANIGGSNRSRLGASQLITVAGGSALTEGRVLAPETGVFTLSISNAPTVSYTTDWGLDASAEHMRLFEIHDATNSDAIAIVRVRSGITLTLDHETMGDIHLGIRLTLKAARNDVNLFQRLVLRVPDAGVEEPFYMPSIPNQGFVNGQPGSFSAQAVDPDAVFYEQHESYTYSLTAAGGVPGWVSVDSQGQVQVHASALAQALTLTISAVNDATPPLTVSQDVTLVVAEELRRRGLNVGASITLFLGPTGSTCHSVTYRVHALGALRQLPCSGTDGPATIGALTYSATTSRTGNSYVAVSGASIFTLNITMHYSDSPSGTVFISQTLEWLAASLGTANPLAFVNSADPQLVEIAADAGRVTTHNSAAALSFAPGHSFVTLYLGSGFNHQSPTSWSLVNTNSAAAAADIDEIAVAGSGVEAAVGFPAGGARRVIPDNQYPFTLTVSATNGLDMISKELVFNRAAASAVTLATVLVTVNNGSVSTFTRRPASPTGAGVTYEAMLVDDSGQPQALPAWLRVASASGEFAVRPHATRGSYQVRVFARSGGRRVSSADFLLHAVTPPRVIASRTSNNPPPHAYEFDVDMGVRIAHARAGSSNVGDNAITCGGATSDFGSTAGFPRLHNSCRLLRFHILRDVLGATYLVTLSVASDFGSSHFLTLTLEIEEVNTTRSQIVGGRIVFVPDSSDDTIVELPAATSISAADTRLATVVVEHSTQVRAELINALAANIDSDTSSLLSRTEFEIERGTSTSGKQTIFIQSDAFTGPLFPDGVTEYRLNLRVAPATDTVPWLHRNVIIRSAAAPAVVRPRFDFGHLASSGSVPYGQGRTFLFGGELRNPDRLPIGWQLIAANGDPLPSGVSLDSNRLAVVVQPGTVPFNVTLVLRGTYYSGTETGRVERTFVVQRGGVPLRVVRTSLNPYSNTQATLKVWLSSLDGCQGELSFQMFWNSTHTTNSTNEKLASGSDLTCTNWTRSNSIVSHLIYDVSDIDEPLITFRSVNLGSQVTLRLTANFQNDEGQAFVRGIHATFDPATMVVGATVSVGEPPVPAAVTVQLAEKPGIGAAAAVGSGTPVATISHPNDLFRPGIYGRRSAWRLIGDWASLLQVTPVSGFAERTALISWAQAITLDHENPNPPAISDLRVTLIQEGIGFFAAQSRHTVLRIILNNVVEASDNAPPVYSGPGTFVRPGGVQSLITLTVTDPEDDTPFSSLMLLRHADLVPLITTEDDLSAGELTLTLSASLPAGAHLVTLSAADSRSGVGRATITLIVSSLSFDSNGRSVTEGVASFSFTRGLCGDVVLDVGYGAEKIRYSLTQAQCESLGSVAATKLGTQPSGFVSSFTASVTFDPAPMVDFAGGKAVVTFAEFPAGTVPDHSVSLGFSRSVEGSASSLGMATSGTQTGFRQYAAVQVSDWNRTIREDGFGEIPDANGAFAVGDRVLVIRAPMEIEDPHWSGGLRNARSTLVMFELEAIPSTASGHEKQNVWLRVSSGFFSINVEHYFPAVSVRYNPLVNYDLTLVNGSGPGARTTTSSVLFQLENRNDVPTLVSPCVDQGPYSASGDQSARTFSLPATIDEDVNPPDRRIFYSIDSSLLPAGVTFRGSTGVFTLAAGDRAAGEASLPVNIVGTNRTWAPATALQLGGCTFTLRIVDYIPGATVTLEVAEQIGHGATRAGGVSLGVINLSEALSGVSWSLRGTSSRLAVSTSTTSADTEAVISTFGTSSDSHPFDYDTLGADRLFGRITVVASAGEVEYAQIVDVVLTDVDESLTIPAIASQSAVAGEGRTIQLPEAANPSALAVTYAATQPDDSALPAWLTYTTATRQLAVAATTSVGTSQMVKYKVHESANSANSDEVTFPVNVISPNTGTIVVNSAGLQPLTRVDGKPGESTTTDISVHLAGAPASRSVVLTLLTGSGLIGFSPDSLEFTPSNHSTPQPVRISVLMTGNVQFHRLAGDGLGARCRRFGCELPLRDRREVYSRSRLRQPAAGNRRRGSAPDRDRKAVRGGRGAHPGGNRSGRRRDFLCADPRFLV